MAQQAYLHHPSSHSLRGRRWSENCTWMCSAMCAGGSHEFLFFCIGIGVSLLFFVDSALPLLGFISQWHWLGAGSYKLYNYAYSRIRCFLIYFAWWLCRPCDTIERATHDAGCKFGPGVVFQQYSLPTTIVSSLDPVARSGGLCCLYRKDSWGWIK